MNIPKGCRLVKVTSSGVQFGNAWYSHESITGYSADQLNQGNCCVTGGAYMKWLSEESPPQPAYDEAKERVDMLAHECSDLSAHIALFKSSSMMGSIKAWLDSESAKVTNAQHAHLVEVERLVAIAIPRLRASGSAALATMLDAALKPADGTDYRKSCEAAHKALSMENQRIVAPGQFKCLACGDVHPGSGNLPCPKMSPTA